MRSIDRHSVLDRRFSGYIFSDQMPFKTAVRFECTLSHFARKSLFLIAYLIEKLLQVGSPRGSR